MFGGYGANVVVPFKGSGASRVTVPVTGLVTELLFNPVVVISVKGAPVYSHVVHFAKALANCNVPAATQVPSGLALVFTHTWSFGKTFGPSCHENTQAPVAGASGQRMSLMIVVDGTGCAM